MNKKQNKTDYFAARISDLLEIDKVSDLAKLLPGTDIMIEGLGRATLYHGRMEFVQMDGVGVYSFVANRKSALITANHFVDFLDSTSNKYTPDHPEISRMRLLINGGSNGRNQGAKK